MPVSTTKVRKTKLRAERWAFLSDIHAPYHDPQAVAVALEVVKEWRPHHLCVVGDLIDFYPISRFEKDPGRIMDLDNELYSARDVLYDIRKAVPRNCDVTFVPGNHDVRMKKFVWSHPELAGLSALQLGSLLEFEKFRIREMPAFFEIKSCRFMVEHGDQVRAKSGTTAMAMSDRRGGSGLSGHTHRLATYRKTEHFGTRTWFENGCLCSMTPEYAVGTPDWQQGFTLMSAWEGGFQGQQVVIRDGRAVFNGEVYAA